MRASAPGKLVLSGAYAVLRGAPAIVTAVDRRVVVDTARAASFETPEVAAGLPLLRLAQPRHPWFDASALREGERKLGLGSSAAICAASLFGLWFEEESAPPRHSWAASIYPIALRAHRTAQGGGSGVDVAAACFGGTMNARLAVDEDGAPPEVTPVDLPGELVMEIWASDRAARTADFVKKVFALEHSAPDSFEETFSRQCAASERTATALSTVDISEVIAGLREQFQALRALGNLAGLPIVLPEVSDLHERLPDEACFLPSGAGGGDVNVYIGREPTDDAFAELARQRNLERVALRPHAPGLTIDS